MPCAARGNCKDYAPGVAVLCFKLSAGMMLYHKVQELESDAETAILKRYFYALQHGRADKIQPMPFYRWQFYAEGRTELIHFRVNLEKLDNYLNSESQRNWAQTNNGNARDVTYEAGPDLSRLPDNAVIALYQELDALHARFPEPPPPKQEPQQTPEDYAGYEY